MRVRRLSNSGISGDLPPTVGPLSLGGPLSQDENSKAGRMNTLIICLFILLVHNLILITLYSCNMCCTGIVLNVLSWSRYRLPHFCLTLPKSSLQDYAYMHQTGRASPHLTQWALSSSSMPSSDVHRSEWAPPTSGPPCETLGNPV